jgi:hypothetical protein
VDHGEHPPVVGEPLESDGEYTMSVNLLLANGDAKRQGASPTPATSTG